MAHQTRKILTGLGTMTARPGAFLIFLAYAIAWPFFDMESFNWHGVATLATWAMTLVIQRAEHRDTQAIHAKLDELLRANGEARDEMVTIDEREPEDVEKERERRTRRSRKSSAAR